MSLRGAAADAARMCLVISVTTAQAYLFPCPLVLACAAAYFLFCALHVTRMLTRDVDTTPFPLLVHGHAPAGYVLTIANTLLVYQLVYIACFLYSCNRAGALCGRMYPATTSCAGAYNATGLTFCTPKSETAHTMLAVTHPPTPLDCTRTWQCYAVGTPLHGSLVLQPLPTLQAGVVFTPAAPPHATQQHGAACRPLGALALYADASVWRPVQTPCHADCAYTATLAAHPHRPLYLAVPRSARVDTRLVMHDPRRYTLLHATLLDPLRGAGGGCDGARLATVTVACIAAAAAYVTAFSAFQNTVRHTASALFLYVCVPVAAFFVQIGSWPSLVATVLLASCIVKCGPSPRLAGWLAGVLALLEAAYLVYVALSGHLYSDLRWQSVRTHMHTLARQSSLVDDVFWGRRRDSFEVFLFYPGLLLSVFCGISAVGAALTV